MLAIDVIDTGIGIPKSAQSRVFEPFAQADTSVTRKFGGTGLGLAISKQLAESMGGGIAITSEEGCGSTFTLSILVGPLDGIVMVDALSDIKSADRVEAAASEVIQLPQAKILVADDGESNRKLIDLVLRRAGVEVVLVENGQLAVERALQNPFDVILMDMQMPVMDGYTATATLREHGYELPIIALTAHAMQGDEEKCRSAGCSGFLTKPIKIDVLLATLRDVLTDRTTLDDLEEISQLVSTAVKELKVEEQPIDLIQQSASRIRDHEPIRCEFPLDDPDFLEIAQEFVERFRQKLSQMCDACIANDYAQLSSLAHWLKGSGGTAGFDVFTQPAHELEQAAAAQDRHKGRSIIETLVKMSSRIELSAPENNSTSAHKALALVSSLPLDDIDFFEIVAEFVERLASKLDEMEQAWRDGNYRRLTELAHWLKGSGGTAGFDAFTEPAHRLGQCAAHCEQETTRLIITEIRQSARIELTKQEPRAEKNLKTPAELLTHNLELNG